MNFIKRSILWIILVASFALMYYVYSIRTVACEDPIEYVIGNIDPKFNMSRVDFEKTIDAAALVWENSLDKNLFEEKNVTYRKNVLESFLETYVDKYYMRQPVVINLIYDERQKIADQNRFLKTQISNTRESADVVKKQFQDLQNRYATVKREYELLLSDYKKGKGGRSELDAKVSEINGLVDQINAEVKKYNYLVKEVNTTINVVNQHTGEFEEGEYVSDEKGERINIYEFENVTTLQRVLSHELGHAFGLDHNENPNSIMYYLNNGKNLAPTKEDMAGVQMICKGK